ncbi:MAG: hypothetical protein HQM10_00575 [Candidatus Riflebacteria bacterium]|nr:hypothetical protein [Candidatus Riflebacteria bacterium]
MDNNSRIFEKKSENEKIKLVKRNPGQASRSVFLGKEIHSVVRGRPQFPLCFQSDSDIPDSTSAVETSPSEENEPNATLSFHPLKWPVQEISMLDFSELILSSKNEITDVFRGVLKPLISNIVTSSPEENFFYENEGVSKLTGIKPFSGQSFIFTDKPVYEMDPIFPEDSHSKVCGINKNCIRKDISKCESKAFLLSHDLNYPTDLPFPELPDDFHTEISLNTLLRDSLRERIQKIYNYFFSIDSSCRNFNFSELSGYRIKPIEHSQLRSEESRSYFIHFAVSDFRDSIVDKPRIGIVDLIENSAQKLHAKILMENMYPRHSRIILPEYDFKKFKSFVPVWSYSKQRIFPVYISITNISVMGKYRPFHLFQADKGISEISTFTSVIKNQNDSQYRVWLITRKINNFSIKKLRTVRFSSLFLKQKQTFKSVELESIFLVSNSNLELPEISALLNKNAHSKSILISNMNRSSREFPEKLKKYFLSVDLPSGFEFQEKNFNFTPVFGKQLFKPDFEGKKKRKFSAYLKKQIETISLPKYYPVTLTKTGKKAFTPQPTPIQLSGKVSMHLPHSPFIMPVSTQIRSEALICIPKMAQEGKITPFQFSTKASAGKKPAALTRLRLTLGKDKKFLSQPFKWLFRKISADRKIIRDIRIELPLVVKRGNMPSLPKTETITNFIPFGMEYVPIAFENPVKTLYEKIDCSKLRFNIRKNQEKTSDSESFFRLNCALSENPDTSFNIFNVQFEANYFPTARIQQLENFVFTGNKEKLLLLDSKDIFNNRASGLSINRYWRHYPPTSLRFPKKWLINYPSLFEIVKPYYGYYENACTSKRTPFELDRPAMGLLSSKLSFGKLSSAFENILHQNVHLSKVFDYIETSESAVDKNIKQITFHKEKISPLTNKLSAISPFQFLQDFSMELKESAAKQPSEKKLRLHGKQIKPSLQNSSVFPISVAARKAITEKTSSVPRAENAAKKDKYLSSVMGSKIQITGNYSFADNNKNLSFSLFSREGPRSFFRIPDDFNSSLMPDTTRTKETPQELSDNHLFLLYNTISVDSISSFNQKPWSFERQNLHYGTFSPEYFDKHTPDNISLSLRKNCFHIYKATDKTSILLKKVEFELVQISSKFSGVPIVCPSYGFFPEKHGQLVILSGNKELNAIIESVNAPSVQLIPEGNSRETSGWSRFSERCTERELLLSSENMSSFKQSEDLFSVPEPCYSASEKLPAFSSRNFIHSLEKAVQYYPLEFDAWYLLNNSEKAFFSYQQLSRKYDLSKSSAFKFCENRLIKNSEENTSNEILHSRHEMFHKFSVPQLPDSVQVEKEFRSDIRIPASVIQASEMLFDHSSIDLSDSRYITENKTREIENSIITVRVEFNEFHFINSVKEPKFYEYTRNISFKIPDFSDHIQKIPENLPFHERKIPGFSIFKDADPQQSWKLYEGIFQYKREKFENNTYSEHFKTIAGCDNVRIRNWDNGKIDFPFFAVTDWLEINSNNRTWMLIEN